MKFTTWLLEEQNFKSTTSGRLASNFLFTTYSVISRRAFLGEKMKHLFRNLSLVFVVFLWSCTSGDDIVDYSNLGPDETESGNTPGFI